MKPNTVTAQIAALPSLPMPDLWALWDRHYATRPRHSNREYLEGRIAYRLQEAAYGGVLASVRDALVKLGEAQSPRATHRGAEVKLPPGSVLLREFGGTEHRVVVADDGTYAWCGERFRSLSAVARRITGVSWSGPAFFGLKARGGGQ